MILYGEVEATGEEGVVTCLKVPAGISMHVLRQDTRNQNTNGGTTDQSSVFTW
jgi:hypothetical protein